MRNAIRIVTLNSCSTSTRLWQSSKTRSYSQPRSIGSLVWGGITWPTWLSDVLARVGSIGRGAAVGGGTLRFKVEVCSRPLSLYGAENQTISNRPNGKIDPGV